MLQSLEVRNYRNLRHLTIEKLGRVNLLLGKNNTGKTSVLEAVAIHVNRGRFDVLLHFLEERGENYIHFESQGTKESADIVKTVNALFNGYPTQIPFEYTIEIGDEISKRTIIKYVWYTEIYLDKQNYPTKKIFSEGEMLSNDALVGIEIKSQGGSFFCPIQAVASFARGQTPLSVFIGGDALPNYQFVRTNHISRDDNSSLWDNILFKEEKEVIDALRLIESSIEDIAFRQERSPERVAVVKLKSIDGPIPLRSMGDGINRILTIILAMVNCRNGYFFIDEFENGLHYSVQEQLWEVIFNLAERLNIQVFATTHSSDCINAFSAVLNSGRHAKESGCMVRLDNFDGTIEATLYDADEIETTTRVNVDPR